MAKKNPESTTVAVSKRTHDRLKAIDAEKNAGMKELADFFLEFALDRIHLDEIEIQPKLKFKVRNQI